MPRCIHSERYRQRILNVPFYQQTFGGIQNKGEIPDTGCSRPNRNQNLTSAPVMERSRAN